MADKRSDRKAADDSFELDLDETMSSWEEVVEEAVAAVEKNQEGGGDRAKGAAEGAASTEAASGEEHTPGISILPDDKEGPAVEGSRANGEDSEGKLLHDRLVRTLADFDNYRKRAEREKEKIKRYALFDVLKEFLDVFDNLERALAASGSAEDLKTGVQMIVRQFSDLLGRHGVEAFDAVGKAFDPTIHEAVMREEPSEDLSVPTVTSEFQRGYRLRDRLLRPAMVGVSMPLVKQGEGETETEVTEESAEAPTEEVASADRQDDDETSAASTEAH